jgi:hypothetical protein
MDRKPTKAPARLAWAAALLACLACTAVVADSHDAAEPGATPLPLLQGGVWQEFRLPDPWIQEHLATLSPRRAVLSLLPPHPGDYAAFTPCSPPSRVVLGVVDEEMVLHEHLLLCADACASEAQPELWGYRSQLTGISVSVHGDGSLDVAARYRERSDEPAPGATTPPVQGEERARHHRISPAELGAAAQRSEAIATCGALLDD